MSYTPGPWYIWNKETELDKNFAIDSPLVSASSDQYDESQDICIIITDNENFAANARLIVVAPDMLAAIEAELHMIYNEYQAEHDDFEAMVAKFAEDDFYRMHNMAKAYLKATGKLI